MAESVEIWPDHDESLSNLNEISPNLVEFGLDLNKISLYLVRSDGFQVNFHRRTPVFVCFRQRTPNIARIFWLYARFGLLGFWERKPANRTTNVGFYGRRPNTNRRSGRFKRFLVRVQVGCSGYSSSGLGWTVLAVSICPDSSHSSHAGHMHYIAGCLVASYLRKPFCLQ